MAEWKQWIPIETLRALTEHAVGNVAVVLYLALLGRLVDFLLPDGFPQDANG